MIRPTRNSLLAFGLLGVSLAMVGMAYASVPLYRLFCEVTGYGGTPMRADGGSDRVDDRTVVVRFDANVSGLPWTFSAEVQQVELKLGETALVNFVAENKGAVPMAGTATFNVQPDVAGAYFNKIECFCFGEQELKPGERIEMPVQFFVSPDMKEDRNLAGTRTITLSYTFFPLAGAGQPVAQSGGDAGGNRM